MSSILTSDIRNRLLVGDAHQILKRVPDESVDCVVTSPPYYLLRDYTHRNQIGHEDTIRAWVSQLVAVLDQLHRVVKDTGTCWLNLGDTYSRHQRQGSQRKSLLLGPERLLLALAERGWIVRNKIIWAKTNPMPHSVRDRFSNTWEYIYMLTKAETGYWFNLDAVRIPHRTRGDRPNVTASDWTGAYGGSHSGITKMKRQGRVGHTLGKNPGDVWRHAKAAHRGHHSATYPHALIETPIIAGCPKTVCVECHRPTCDCRAERQPGLVLDPFIGTGTTAHVARRLGRDWLGIDLTADHFVPPGGTNREQA